MNKALIAASLILGSCATIPDRVITHHNGRGTPIQIKVTMQCHKAHPGRGYADIDNKVIYLCGYSEVLSHEKAHFAGMLHTRWIYDGLGIPCANVIYGGLNTGYQTGDIICVSEYGEFKR